MISSRSSLILTSKDENLIEDQTLVRRARTSTLESKTLQRTSTRSTTRHRARQPSQVGIRRSVLIVPCQPHRLRLRPIVWTEQRPISSNRNHQHIPLVLTKQYTPLQTRDSSSVTHHLSASQGPLSVSETRISCVSLTMSSQTDHLLASSPLIPSLSSSPLPFVTPHPPVRPHSKYDIGSTTGS